MRIVASEEPVKAPQAYFEFVQRFSTSRTRSFTSCRVTVPSQSIHGLVLSGDKRGQLEAPEQTRKNLRTFGAVRIHAWSGLTQG